MGHERVGALPRTKRWGDVVAQMAESSGSQDDVAAIANAILQNVRAQFRKMHSDDGVVAAFQFLVALTKSASLEDLGGASFSPGVNLEGSPSTLSPNPPMDGVRTAEGG